MSIKKLYIIIFFLPAAFFAQRADSLTKALALVRHDTDKIKTLVLLALEAGSNDPEKAFEYATKAVKICESPEYDTGTVSAQKCMAGAYRNQGVACYFLGDYSTALPTLAKALRLFTKVKNAEGSASVLGWIGNTYYSKGDFEKALEALLSALKLQEQVGNTTGVSAALNGIANIYQIQQNYRKALEYYFMSLKIRLGTNDSISVAYTYNNLGLIYMDADSLDKSLAYHLKCLHLVEKYNDKKGMENSYGNIGEVYAKQKKYSNALAYQQKSLKISEEISDKIGVSASYNDMGKIYFKLNDLRNALNCFEKGLLPARESGNKAGMEECYYGLASTFYAIGEYEKATENFEQYTVIKDSLMNQSNVENLDEMQARFDTEKKEKDIELLQQDKNIRALQMSEQEANINRQRLILYSAIGGLALIIFLVFFIWKSYRQKKKINVGLERKNIEINIQTEQIEKKNILITDSIEYARSIQNAILPTDDSIKNCVADSFFLFLPKDIVSGDFYWLHQKDDKVLLAAIDCTGHGVPGAFMSVMAYNMLEHIVSEKKFGQPSSILDELNRTVIESLHQESETSSAKYGMDISLLELDRKNGKLRFAAAHNSLYIVHADQTTDELKANNATIGMALEKFAHHEAEIKNGDTLYMFTDGYPDQKGGPQNKKFFSAELKKLLLSISTKGCAEQKEILHRTILEWRGSNEQIDDILVIGIKV